MTITLNDFCHQFVSNPVLSITVVLIMAVIMVNGWTDAPNAIAACVSTGVMELNKAVKMAAVFNFAGMFCISVLNPGVAYTIYHLADFGKDADKALLALCAAMAAIIIWSVCAWGFGIPTSESHALIAGLSGAAIALHNGIKGINGAEWSKVIIGLVLSVVMGLLFGWLGGKTVQFARKEMKKKNRYGYKEKKIIRNAQIAGSAAMAFMHGAQDGQKFMGVLLLGIFLANGQRNITSFHIPLWMMVFCSMIMAAGTSIGGGRIIKTVGNDMVKLKKPQGAASDAAGAVCLFISSMIGIPVSTTHVKTTAILGVAAAENKSGINSKIVEEMILTWILTFPGCALIGYITVKIFMFL